MKSKYYKKDIKTLLFPLTKKELYLVSNKISSHYVDKKLPKKDGSFRLLSVPDEKLKFIQKVIVNKILRKMPVSKYATAYVKRSGIIKNAQPHVGHKKILKLDIYKFFDNIHYSLVKEKVFPSKDYSPELRILLTILCYNQNKLPQGAPTSPYITNIIMFEFDKVIGSYCEPKGITYARYCDDLTFSSNDDFNVNQLINIVKTRLKKLGLRLKYKKIHVIHQNQQQNVTGLVVNQKVNVPSKYKKQFLKELHIFMKFKFNSCNDYNYINSLLGKLNYINGFSNIKNFVQCKNMLLTKLNQLSN